MEFEKKMQLILLICMSGAVIISFILAYFDNKSRKKEEQEKQQKLELKKEIESKFKNTNKLELEKHKTTKQFNKSNNDFDLMELEILDDWN